MLKMLPSWAETRDAFFGILADWFTAAVILLGFIEAIWPPRTDHARHAWVASFGLLLVGFILVRFVQEIKKQRADKNAAMVRNHQFAEVSERIEALIQGAPIGIDQFANLAIELGNDIVGFAAVGRYGVMRFNRGETAKELLEEKNEELTALRNYRDIFSNRVVEIVNGLFHLHAGMPHERAFYLQPMTMQEVSEIATNIMIAAHNLRSKKK
jgi:hypothetical protein